MLSTEGSDRSPVAWERGCHSSARSQGGKLWGQEPQAVPEDERVKLLWHLQGGQGSGLLMPSQGEEEFHCCCTLLYHAADEVGFSFSEVAESGVCDAGIQGV